jgi:hypothetical protein
MQALGRSSPNVKSKNVIFTTRSDATSSDCPNAKKINSLLLLVVSVLVIKFVFLKNKANVKKLKDIALLCWR